MSIYKLFVWDFDKKEHSQLLGVYSHYYWEFYQ